MNKQKVMAFVLSMAAFFIFNYSVSSIINKFALQRNLIELQSEKIANFDIGELQKVNQILSLQIEDIKQELNQYRFAHLKELIIFSLLGLFLIFILYNIQKLNTIKLNP